MKFREKMLSVLAGVAATTGAMGADKGSTIEKPLGDSTTEKVRTYTPSDSMDKKTTVPYSMGKMEDKNYKIVAKQIIEKNGYTYFVLGLEKIKGEYSSYQEVIDAITKINPNLRLLTSEETKKLLDENKDKEAVSKRGFYVALGGTITGADIDIKAKDATGSQFNAFTFDGKNGAIVSAGTNIPSDNNYYFPAVMKSKTPDALASK